MDSCSVYMIWGRGFFFLGVYIRFFKDHFSFTHRALHDLPAFFSLLAGKGIR